MNVPLPHCSLLQVWIVRKIMWIAHGRCWRSPSDRCGCSAMWEDNSRWTEQLFTPAEAQPPTAGRCWQGWWQLPGRGLRCSGTRPQSTSCSGNGDVATDPGTTCCASSLCENSPLILAKMSCMFIYFSTDGGIAWPRWHRPSVSWCCTAPRALPCNTQSWAPHNEKTSLSLSFFRYSLSYTLLEESRIRDSCCYWWPVAVAVPYLCGYIFPP